MFFSTSMTEIILLMYLKLSLLVLKYRNIVKSPWLNMGQLFSAYIMLISRIKKRLVIPLKNSWIKMKMWLKKQQMIIRKKLHQNLDSKKLLMNGVMQIRTQAMISKMIRAIMKISTMIQIMIFRQAKTDTL